jgi:hypothetical protein
MKNITFSADHNLIEKAPAVACSQRGTHYTFDPAKSAKSPRVKAL